MEYNTLVGLSLADQRTEYTGHFRAFVGEDLGYRIIDDDNTNLNKPLHLKANIDANTKHEYNTKGTMHVYE